MSKLSYEEKIEIYNKIKEIFINNKESMVIVELH